MRTAGPGALVTWTESYEAVRLFVGTLLAGLPIGHGPSGTVLVADTAPNRLQEASQVADALVPVIGPLPVMVTDDFGDTLRIRPDPEPGPSESELPQQPAARAHRRSPTRA